MIPCSAAQCHQCHLRQIALTDLRRESEDCFLLHVVCTLVVLWRAVAPGQHQQELLLLMVDQHQLLHKTYAHPLLSLTGLLCQSKNLSHAQRDLAAELLQGVLGQLQGALCQLKGLS